MDFQFLGITIHTLVGPRNEIYDIFFSIPSRPIKQKIELRVLLSCGAEGGEMSCGFHGMKGVISLSTETQTDRVQTKYK